MNSLRLSVLSNPSGITDGDASPMRTPNRQVGEPPPDIGTMYERLSNAFRSKNPAFLMWGLSAFPSACEKDRKCLQLLSLVTNSFKNSNVRIEHSAVVCVQGCIRKFGKHVAAPLIGILIDRINESSAIEYGHCLGSLILYFNEDTIRSCIVPLIFKLIGKSTDFHYLAAEILIIAPFRLLHLSTDQYLKLLNLQVIIENYLYHFLEIAQNVYSNDWFSQTLPIYLLQLANNNVNYRSHIISVILSHPNMFKHQSFFMFLKASLTWASQSQEIAIILLSKADSILSPKTVDLIPIFKDLFKKALNIPNTKIRSKIAEIIVNNPSIVNGYDLEDAQIVLSLATDNSHEVRLSFLNNFPFFYLHSKIQDIIFNEFLNLFNDESNTIKERLGKPDIYSCLQLNHLVVAISQYFKLMSSIKKWRIMANFIGTYTGFPVDAIINSWNDAFFIVNRAAIENPFALYKHYADFYVHLTRVLPETPLQKMNEMIVSTFAHNDKAQIRMIFLKLCSYFCIRSINYSFIQQLWKSAKELTKDPVVDVRAASIISLVSFRAFFLKIRNMEFESEALKLFNEMENDENPFIQDKLDQTINRMKEMKSPAIVIPMQHNPIPQFSIVEQSKSLRFNNRNEFSGQVMKSESVICSKNLKTPLLNVATSKSRGKFIMNRSKKMTPLFRTSPIEGGDKLPTIGIGTNI
ncbi:hypothetical protein TRFO_43145 [Tritrichomonas foetus]|uniref:HEAT repeat family protein n=1 Tax=Tritrichomonas foetus TaxID=1144522 RepID=A0A1J4KSV1_9EUKA|nr:hypothetical protein TRFO_43145 [Tritrichomonas foetus]|eukprot:OHT14186.1 hypothetical protein TRFO_43145 [Tritrichomonas foetus]